MAFDHPLKMGRLPRAHDKRVPLMETLRAGLATPPPPLGVDWLTKLPNDLGMMLNDSLGDCTCAAAYHALQVWSANANPPIWANPDSDVLAMYEQACGYNPADPSTDQGGVEQDVLAFWLQKGVPVGKKAKHRQRLTAFVELNVSDIDNVKWAIADCGVVYIGFNVPAYLMNSGPPQLWDVDPNGDQSIVGGHAVVLAGYSGGAAHLISWGQRYQMSWEFWSQFVDEAYALIDCDWVQKMGTTPGGMTLAQLEAAMNAFKAAPNGGKKKGG